MEHTVYLNSLGYTYICTISLILLIVAFYKHTSIAYNYLTVHGYIFPALTNLITPKTISLTQLTLLSFHSLKILFRNAADIFNCYSSKGCHGNLVMGNTGRSDCCMPGGGLSFMNDMSETCQECFSM